MHAFGGHGSGVMGQTDGEDVVLIEFEGVRKRFGGNRGGGGVLALRDLSLTVEQGSVVGVVGPNGAGKSTLFALLLGFMQPSAGKTLVAGLPPREYTRKHGAGYLPERFMLPPDWSVRAAMEGLADLERLSNAQARAAQVVTLLGLDRTRGQADFRTLARAVAASWPGPGAARRSSADRAG